MPPRSNPPSSGKSKGAPAKPAAKEKPHRPSATASFGAGAASRAFGGRSNSVLARRPTIAAITNASDDDDDDEADSAADDALPSHSAKRSKPATSSANKGDEKAGGGGRSLSKLQSMLDKTSGAELDEKLRPTWEDEFEMEYLREKLGIKSTDAFSEGSQLIKEFRQDGIDDLFDILLPVAASTVETKGRKPLAKFDESKSEVLKWEREMKLKAEKAAAKAKAKEEKKAAKAAAKAQAKAAKVAAAAKAAKMSGKKPTAVESDTESSESDSDSDDDSDDDSEFDGDAADAGGDDDDMDTLEGDFDMEGDDMDAFLRDYRHGEGADDDADMEGDVDDIDGHSGEDEDEEDITEEEYQRLLTQRARELGYEYGSDYDDDDDGMSDQAYANSFLGGDSDIDDNDENGGAKSKRGRSAFADDQIELVNPDEDEDEGGDDEDEDDEEDDEHNEAAAEEEAAEKANSKEKAKKPDIFGRDLPDANPASAGGSNALSFTPISAGFAVKTTPAAAGGSSLSSLAAAASAAAAAGADGGAASAGKYVPPAVRKAMAAAAAAAESGFGSSAGANAASNAASASASASAQSGEVVALTAGAANPVIARMRQQINGILNKISPLTLTNAFAEVEKMITATSRGDLNEALCHCIQHTCLAQPRVLPAILSTMTAIVAALHRIHGTQVGTVHMERVVLEIDYLCGHYNATSLPKLNPRALPSLFTVLGALVVFKVVSTALALGGVAHLLAAKEKDLPWDVRADAITAMFNICGLTLRQDDPVALKQVISDIQSSVRRGVDRDLSLAFPNLNDALTRLRNNQWPADGSEEHVATLTKWIVQHVPVHKDSKVSHGKNKDGKGKDGKKSHSSSGDKAGVAVAAERQINANWDDVLAIPETGRWWLVGAAFRPATIGLKRKADEESKKSKDNSEDEFSDDGAGAELDALNELAAQQGMNTNIRRAVFSIVMGSSDYLDAFEKLRKLNLNSKQDPQVVRVIIHCCSQEGAFNPYYAALVGQLCSVDARRWGFTAKVVLWNVLKEWREAANAGDSNQARAVANVASLAAFLTQNGYVPLAFLSDFDFDELSSVDVLFLFKFFTALLAAVGDKPGIKALVAGLGKAAGKVGSGLDFFLMKYFLSMMKKQGQDALYKAGKMLSRMLQRD